jgi:hypothetical protein
MRKNDTIEATAKPVLEVEQPVTLAELAAEGFGWSRFATTPRAAVEALARQLDGAVELDDLGRYVTDRDTARRLFTQRTEAEARAVAARERQRARHAEQSARNRPTRGGIPVKAGQEGATPLERLGAEHNFSAADERMDAFISGRSSGRRFTQEAS